MDISAREAERFVDEIEDVCRKHGLSFEAVFADAIVIHPFKEHDIDSLRTAEVENE
jgi:hypothetical protein